MYVEKNRVAKSALLCSMAETAGREERLIAVKSDGECVCVL